MKITFYGHASLGIEVGGKHILVDPYISANPEASGLPQEDAVLIRARAINI